MKRVLVTGGTGFIGRHAAARLVELGYEVHIATRAPAAIAGAVCHRADLLDPEAAAALMEAVHPTHLLHAAWNVEPGKYTNSAENLAWVEASLRLLKAFGEAGGRRCVTAGTCAEYEWGHDICRENETPCQPASLYGASKHALQIVQSEYARAASISSAWGRIFHLYGPGEHEQRLVSSLALALLRGEPAACTEGLQVRDFLHVSDVGGALAAILDSDIEGPVNIGSGEPVPLRKIIDLLGRITERPDLLRTGAIPTRPNDPPRLFPDTARLRSIGFRPRFTLEDGLADTISWWRKELANRADGN